MTRDDSQPGTSSEPVPPRRRSRVPMAVSTGSVDITPDPGYPMGGYGGDAPRLADGTNEPLMARCTVLWDAGRPKVIVTADVLGFGRTMHQAIRSGVVDAGVESPDFVLTATHTHNGPVLPEKLHPYNSYNLTDLTEVEAYSFALIDRIVALVTDTLASPRTRCTLDYHVTDEIFSFNREGLPHHEVDVPVLVARRTNGTPRAVLFGYGAHPVAANGQFLFDPDYPAQAIKEIEAIGDDVFAQFLLGPAGDQNPLRMETFTVADEYGRGLGLTVVNAIETPGRPVKGRIGSSYREIDLPLDITESPGNLAAVRGTFLARAARPGTPGIDRRHAETAVHEIDTDTFERAVTVPIQVWTFQGDPALRIVFCGGEVVSGYAVVLRNLLGGSDAVWFNGYSNELPAYLPSNILLTRPSYAGGIDRDSPGIAGGSMKAYNYIGHFRRDFGALMAPGVEQEFLEHLNTLIDSIE